MLDRKHLLLATLGGQPQVITFTLDLLLKTYPIADLIVLHPRPSQERLHRSLARVRAEFPNDYYTSAGRVIHFRSHVLQYADQPLDDIADDQHADGVLDTIHHLISDLKRQGYCIHLSVSGGRRLMGLLAVSVAALNFDRYDRIWHLYTPSELQERADQGKIMHAPPDAGVRLIQGPFLSLGSYISTPASSFRQAQTEQRSQFDTRDHTACDHVFKTASPAQRKVLQAFSKGWNTQQVAQALDITQATVHSHKTKLLQLCANAWNIASHDRLDYHFLHVKFARYFSD